MDVWLSKAQWDAQVDDVHECEHAHLYVCIFLSASVYGSHKADKSKHKKYEKTGGEGEILPV